MSAVGRFLTDKQCSRVAVCAIAIFMWAGSANALSLKNAISVALDSNPEIGEAIENREAHEFELRQGIGLALPTVDLEMYAGTRRLDNASRRLAGTDGDALYPAEAQIVATQPLFDGGRAGAEIYRQASRVDSASFRITERSEYIALQVTREYLEYLLQAEIVSASAKNVRIHQGIASNIGSGLAAGTLTEADRQQVRERVLSAKSRLREAEEELSAAAIRFNKLVGMPLTNPKMPSSISGHLPASLEEALKYGRTHNPRVHMANADIDFADGQVKVAKADMLPRVYLEGRARVGNDIDGSEGRTEDLQARVVMKWNLYRGGIKKANEQEQIHRASEQRMIQHRILRDIEEAVRLSWDRRAKQADLAATLRAQTRESNNLVNSYREQFAVGQRSLLDVLDAQNTGYNVGVRAKTASYASVFAEYRLLAAAGLLLETLGLVPPRQSDAYAREEFGVDPTAPAEIYKRVPTRQVNIFPFDLLAPIR